MLKDVIHCAVVINDEAEVVDPNIVLALTAISHGTDGVVTIAEQSSKYLVPIVLNPLCTPSSLPARHRDTVCFYKVPLSYVSKCFGAFFRFLIISQRKKGKIWFFTIKFDF